jgi:predicted helicase
MSIQLIQKYYAEVDKIIRYGGSRNESSLRKPFQDLLEQYGRARGLVLVAEVEMISKKGSRIRPDGVLKDALRQDWGYWESKDEKDDIEAEIAAKLAKGYPSFNILFEDTHTAVLVQNGEGVLRVPFSDAQGLDRLLTRWAGYEPREVAEFHKAIELFSQEIGGLAEALRQVIGDQLAGNGEFARALDEFLALCQKAINPKIEMADVREMIIQHVLTEDIFMRVFDEAEFHRENVIARKLQEVAGTFYRGETKRNVHARIAPYYEAINARASQISDHHEKQKFLKALYESFYRAYNPKAADRLGIVYTPDEIVRFMIESADHLVYQHFGKGLGERGVEILDPATGTGTFITELIEYLPPQQLEYKYEHEIHCNEVSILPYYIANLNIEYTFKQKVGRFKEFENICFVDTLDNMGFEHTGQQLNFFGITDANAERITRQNSKPIMLVIGNPPYNAWQENFNNQNANRAYPEIDKRIKETYIKAGTAQNQIAVYDMYVRFLRWASDRVGKNGIVAFVSNNSFIDSRSYDGFRKTVTKEFNEIHIVNLKGNARTSGEQRQREGGNVFDDQIKVGIAVYFLVRKEGQKGFRAFYNEIGDFVVSQEKRAYLREHRLSDLPFTTLQPDSKNNWLHTSESDWDTLLPLVGEKKAIFDLYSNGIKTQRDEWVYDLSRENLAAKMRFFGDVYQKTLSAPNYSGKNDIKWDADLQKYLERGLTFDFDENKIVPANYRPYVKTFLYFDKRVNGRAYQLPSIFPNSDAENLAIWWKTGPDRPQFALAVDTIPDLLPAGGSICFPLYRYAPAANVGATRPGQTGETSGKTVPPDAARDGLDGSPLSPMGMIRPGQTGESSGKTVPPDAARDGLDGSPLPPAGMTCQGQMGESSGKTVPPDAARDGGSSLPPTEHATRLDNITDWALGQFQKHYKDKKITKPDIFHYVYAVLHHPAYRAKYEINLKREFPRIPFYEDTSTSLSASFWQWAAWGERLMNLHLGYEGVEPYALERLDVETLQRSNIQTKLMARKDRGEIEIDSVTTLRGIPPEAWEYRLGTYSALEWVLERYKEKKPKDPTIAEKFNSYRFAEYKESVIELLGKVCRVSVETMKIIQEMP